MKKEIWPGYVVITHEVSGGRRVAGWLFEGGSYPIKILDKKRVQVLASSCQMGAKYGAAPVVVKSRWDDGEVIHVVSHFYHQIATKGPAVAAKNAVDQYQGLSPEQKAERRLRRQGRRATPSSR